MKYLALASLVFLAACKTETTGNDVNGFEVACMNGVEYYFDTAGAYGKSLAPVIDSETLTYVRCEGN
jgi:hypothetical protein